MDDQRVGFGKFSHLTFKELAETEPDYIDWFFKQEGIETSRPQLYEYLTSHGFEKKAKNYLDHNFFQAEFTDINKIKSLLPSDADIRRIIFEDLCNADIVVEYHIPKRGIIYNASTRYIVLIELKPTVSNDYPEILRQMRKQHRSYRFYYPDIPPSIIRQMLVCQSYTGKVPLDKVRIMYGDIEFRVLDGEKMTT